MTPLTLDEKRLVNFGPQTKKVIDVHIDLPKWTLFGRLYFGPYMVMCPQIFIRTRDCTRLANAHPNGDAPHQKNYDEILKSGLKFSVCAFITSGIVGIFSPNFFRPPCDELWSTNEKL